MSNVKTISVLVEHYETTDGQTFQVKSEAEKWQEMLDGMSNITMLTEKFEVTKEPERCFNVYLDTYGEVEAFRAYQYDTVGTPLKEIERPGHYLYDESRDQYVHIESEIDRLERIIERIDEVR